VRWGEDPSYVFDQILTMHKLKKESGGAHGSAEAKRYFFFAKAGEGEMRCV
jgi:hypothetical protein